MKQIIKDMKCETFGNAQSKQIEIFDNSNNKIGYLIPIGNWILQEKEIIEQIMTWRKRSMRMFLTQFDATYGRTLNYLKDLAIAKEDRLLFLIYTNTNKLVGHIGIANITKDKTELDNLIRGDSGGHPRLMYFSEITLLDWCFNTLNTKENNLHILSFNSILIETHTQIGYRIVNEYFLKKEKNNGIISHTKVNKKSSNVNYKIMEMLLNKKDFYNGK